MGEREQGCRGLRSRDRPGRKKGTHQKGAAFVRVRLEGFWFFCVGWLGLMRAVKRQTNKSERQRCRRGQGRSPRETARTVSRESENRKEALSLRTWDVGVSTRAPVASTGGEGAG